MIFARLLKRYREMNKLNKSELARRIGVSPEYIMNMEKGKSHPSRETLNLICDALSVDKDQRKEFLYSAISEKLDPYVLEIIQDYRAGFIAERAIKEGIHGHLSANAECPYCHKDFAIDVKGEDITVTGKISTKAKKV